MKQIMIVAVTSLVTLSTPLMAEDNEAFCARMDAAGKLESRPKSDCICVYEQADATMPAERKTVLQKNHEDGVQGMAMMQAMMETGTMEEVIASMDAYSKAIQQNCNLPG